MSGLDVEALLESTAATPADPPAVSEGHDDRSRADTTERRDRSRDRRRRSERSRDRRPDRDTDGDEAMKSDTASANGSLRSRKRSKSRESERRRHRRDDYRSSGDFYRGGGRARSRSRSPYDDRHYRPNRRERDEERRPRRENDTRRGTPSRKSPEITEDERDKRTIFVQQLAARLRTKDLITFFEKVGPVKEAQIVKDRVSGRSKGYVVYVHRNKKHFLIFL